MPHRSRFLVLFIAVFVSHGQECRGSVNPQKCPRQLLSFNRDVPCTYSYELAVHTARGSRSTESDGFHVHALVDVTPVSSEDHPRSPLHLLRLDIREPRLRRARGTRVLVNHPVNEEFEEQLSKPFYFRQHEHGSVADVLLPKDESPEVVALKKGVAGAFQVNLENAGLLTNYRVQEHDDSGHYNAEYTVLTANMSNAQLRRTWTNYDYEEFADGMPVRGEHKVQSQHDVHVQVQEGKIHRVHRTNRAYFRPSQGHARADNLDEFPDQDIEMSTRGYSKLTLRSCSPSKHHRTRRSATDGDHTEHVKTFKRESLVFKDAEKIKWNDHGGEEIRKSRSLYELLRCFTDKTSKENEIADCSRELNFLVRNDEETFKEVCNILTQRTHQNITSWAVLVSSLAWHGQLESQDTLAQVLKSEYPNMLSKEEYEALLEGIFYLPKGPLHQKLYKALFESAIRGHRHNDAMAMLVLSGLVKRAKLAGFNETLHHSVAELIHSSYRNKSNLYRADTEEHESYLRDHIWAFGNLGHLSGLSVILQHTDHDSSGIRSAVMSAMRKLPQVHTDHHLIRALYEDEHTDVKATVVGVLIERHQALDEPMVAALEHAFWHAEDEDNLDSSFQELLENHGNHPKAVHLRKKRSIIRRQKRALIPLLRPREFQLGPSKRWVKTFGGKWLGAESIIQFVNQVKLRVGIFGGSFEINLDNSAKIHAHILKFGFTLLRGKAAFKASASFKNDFPKDLIHAVADAGDDLLGTIDGITNVIVEQIEKVKQRFKGFVPLYIDKFVDFVNKVVKFVENLFKPLKPIKLINKVISFFKDVLGRLTTWKWMLDKINKIQLSLGRLTLIDDVFEKVIAALDRILSIVDRIAIYLPHKLPANFRVDDLFRQLKGTPVTLHLEKIADYFKSLGFKIPGGFHLQLPFKFSIHFTFYMERFKTLILRLSNFGNNFLDLSSVLDALKTIRFPRLRLPELESRLPAVKPWRGFQFGLSFDWKISLRFDLNLKTPNFQQFLTIFEKLGDFFNQFGDPDFSLEQFFESILPGNNLDLTSLFQELFQGGMSSNMKNPAQIFQEFLGNILSRFDLNSANVTAISDLANFFSELGPSVVDFSKESVHKLCRVYKLALNSTQEFKDFGENVEQEGIRILQEVENITQTSLNEMLNFTMVVDSLIDEIERNFTQATRGFVSNSLKELNSKLQEIQNLADQVVDFANGTASKVTGACSEAANFSAKIIDDVQDAAHEALGELDVFIGPIATDIEKVGEELKTAVTRVETWYNKNMASRVGKISRIAQILSDFLAIINTKKGFLGTVREVANKINEVLRHLTNLPEYSRKARKTADDIINFAQRAADFKTEIRKLDLRQKFGIDYDQKVRDICSKFKVIAGDTINRLASFNVVEEVNAFFSKEAEQFIAKAVAKFRRIKEPINDIQGELRDISNMVQEVMNVFIGLKPFTQNFSPILATVSKLPDCQQVKRLFLDSTKPCVKKALSVGRYTLEQYKALRKEVAVLYSLVPETWKNFKIQKCIKGGNCVSKVFVNQAKGIKDKIDFLRDKFREASGFSGMLDTCKQGVENITVVVDTVKNLVEQVNNFSLRDDFDRIKDVLQKVTGRQRKVDQLGRERRSINGVKNEVQRIMDYIEKAKKTQEKVKVLIESTFKAMQSVYDDAIDEHVQKIKDVREKLKMSYELWKKTKDVNNLLQSLDTIVKGASDYADNLKGVTSSLSSPILDLLTETGELSDEVKPYLDKYGKVLTDASDKVNGFLDKVTDFLNKIQLRQRGLDPRDYKPWDQYPYCSESACIRSIRRSSSLYYSTIFTWKFPHLDDLSSMEGANRWLTPGLFDDYKVEGIAQLSEDEMLLGMHGVSGNKGKASLLVVTNLKSANVKKIIQLGDPSNPFNVAIGGVAIARDMIWISDSKASEIYRVSKRSVSNSITSPQPSWVSVSGGISVEGLASSVSYDEPTNFLWVTDGNAGKAYGYRLSVNGDLVKQGLTADRLIYVGKSAQGMAIVRQFNNTYVCVSKCKSQAGFQCKLEFHDLSSGDETGENTLARVVRTPSGLESVQAVDSTRLVLAFSSGTFAEKDQIERIAGDFEDRYFTIRLPILKITFGIYENCLMFEVMGDWIIRPRRLFSIADRRCGTLRKRSLEQQLLDADIYSDELEQIHKNTNRARRDLADPGACTSLYRSEMEPRYQQFFPEYSQIIIVFGIPVRLFAGAGGYYVVDWEGQICMRDRIFKLGLIPGAWISVYAGASVSLFIVEAGITIEAIILETYLIPELRVKIDKWPLKACIVLKIRMTPLRIRVWLWYRFRLCIRIKCKLFGCSIRIRWCSKKTLAEWTWSARTIDRTLFTNCKQDVDRTPPTSGTCTARQVTDSKYFIQWHGFHEDTSINNYRVLVGSIEGSGDDFGVWAGNSLSLVVSDLTIMHGRNVHVGVFATNAQGMDSSLAKCPTFVAKRRSPQIHHIYDGAEVGTDLDYQADNYAIGMNYALKSDPQEVISVMWGAFLSPKCTLEDAQDNIVPMSPVGDSPAIQASGLNLEHGRKYYTKVMVMDRLGLKTIMCSDGIVIDTTPPIAGYLWDGAGEDDSNFIPSLRRVRATFAEFQDPESPIVKYEWQITNKISGISVTLFEDISVHQRTPMIDGLALELGAFYFITLRGTNAAGLQTTILSNGFVADNTPPVCDDGIIDVTSKSDKDDVDFVRELKSIQAKWMCKDDESGIHILVVGVGTYPGGDDIRPFSAANILQEEGAQFVDLDNITILPKVRYHVTVKVFNGARLKRTITSNGILMDTTPPTVADQYIKDGLQGRDKNFTNERFTFSAHWEKAFVDAESGLAEYHVGLGTKPGLADIKQFKNLGTSTAAILTGIVLESGTRYFVTVMGCNGVQMCSNGSSNGAVVDFVPPHSGDVITGYQGPPKYYQWLTKSTWARWDWCLADEKRGLWQIDQSQCSNDSFYDIHSGIAGFGMSVLSLREEAPLAPVKEVGRVRLSGRSISMEDGIYSVVIEAYDRAGVRSRGLSNTLIVDSSPPMITHVQHGISGDPVQYIKDDSFRFTAYFELEDDLSKIAEYKVGIGSYAGTDDVISFKAFHLSIPVSSLRTNWTTEKAYKLENGRRYYVTVWAANSAGLLSIKSSTPLLADFDPPHNGIVMDGWGFSDALFHSYSSIYRVHWKGFTDFSGIQNIFVGLSSLSDCRTCDVHPFVEGQASLDYYMLSGLTLTSGRRCYACVKLVDRAGNELVSASTGVLVDTTPPVPGEVTDGRTGEDRGMQTEGSILRASWTNFTEQETTIVSYKLAFGSAPGSSNIQDFTDVGLVTSAASSRLKVSELTSGQRYYASVVAYNVLGVPSSVTSSNGVLVDFTPPTFTSAVRDGLDPNADLHSTSEDVLSATWHCEDPDTSIDYIQVAFGLQPGGSDIVNFTTIASHRKTFSVKTALRPGYRYFATVRCVNKAGLRTSTISGGVVYDTTPPNGLLIVDGDYQSSLLNVSLKWKFVDSESRIQRYVIFVYSQKHDINAQGPFVCNGSATSSTINLDRPLSHGVKYYVNVTAVNLAGLNTTLDSDGFTVDSTHPVCAQVWDGDQSYQLDVQYVPKTTKMSISWNCYDYESYITLYRYSVKNAVTGEVILPFHTIKIKVNSSGSAVITGGGKWMVRYDEGSTYSVGIEITNAVLMKSVYWTNGVVVDSTPPALKDLKLSFNPKTDSLYAMWKAMDEESGLKTLSWGMGTAPDSTDVKNFTEVSTSTANISITSISLVLGRTYFLSLFAVNKAGLSSKTAANGVVIDRTTPTIGTVVAHYVFPKSYDRNKNYVTGASFVASWTGFFDPESGVDQYSWAVGTNSQDIKQKDDRSYTVMSNDDSSGGTVIENQTLANNTTYFVCIRATNGAGLQRTDCSQGMLVILGKFSSGTVNDGPVTRAKDIDFQMDDKAIWAHWDGFKDPVFGISRYDWCIGDQPPGMSNPGVCRWPYMEIHHLKTFAQRFHNLSLTHGTKYYVTVKAENIRGETVSSTSDGVTVDRTPPVGKAIHVSPATGKETIYVTSPSAPVVTWSMEDPESGIKFFMVGVGSFPQQDDIMSFRRVSGLSRSVDLDTMKLTLSEGLGFYVNVAGVNMLGLETMLTSQQVVVDWSPPVAGQVVDGNETSPEGQRFVDIDFQQERGVLSSHWHGFEDRESEIVYYRWCIGTTQGKCDTQEMTNAALETSFHHPIVLQEGQRYYVTIEATNGAGLMENAYSDGVTLDTTPPMIGKIEFEATSSVIGQSNVALQNDAQEILFSWASANDDESGISKLAWCAGSSSSKDDFVSWTPIDPAKWHITYFFSKALMSGTYVFITVKAWNGAGMTSQITSKALVIDSTPPSEGSVIVGNAAEIYHLRQGEPIKAEWSGFKDAETEVSHYEWAVCQSFSTVECITPYVYVGKETSVTNEGLDLKPGVSYVFVVRAYNPVSLFTEVTSNPLILNSGAPMPGSVFDGDEVGKDISVQSSTSFISANWQPFSDLHGRIVSYEMCLGRKPEICDIRGFTNVGVNLDGTINGLQLNHTGQYFITIQASNAAGYREIATSNGIRIDNTPPVGKGVRDGQTLVDIDLQPDDNFISANWDEFEDPESGIASYAWCAGTWLGSCDVIAQTDVGDSTLVGRQISPSLTTGMEVFVTLTVYNGANSMTKVFTDGVKVDNSVPLISQVLDVQVNNTGEDLEFITAKDQYCVSWEVADLESGVASSELSVCSTIDPADCLVQDSNIGNLTTICLADLEYQEGVEYTAIVRVFNKVGLSAEMSSDGFMIDSTSPLIGEVLHIENPSVDGEQFTQSVISVEWDGFWDKESGVSKYFVCIGTQPGECNVMNFSEVVNKTAFSIADSTLLHWKTYYVSVVAENNAGLRSEVKSSDGVTVDKTGAVGTQTLFDGEMDGVDIDIQQSARDISANWNGFEDSESDIVDVTWCAGVTHGKCNIVSQKHLEPSKTSIHWVLDESLSSGQRYYVTVQVTNGAGVMTTVTSDGVTVDTTPPLPGQVLDGGSVDVDYVYGEHDVTARWFNFSDPESGVQSYEVAVCDMRNSSYCPQGFVLVGQVTNVTITGLDLETGAHFVIKVRATNHAGLQIEATSDGFTVDFSPPSASKAWDGTGVDIQGQSDSSQLNASWVPFKDSESGITKYEVCLGVTPGECSVVNFTDVGLRLSHSFTGMALLHGVSYYTTVKGTNGIGLSSVVVTNGVLIDLTPPKLKDSNSEVVYSTATNHNNSTLEEESSLDSDESSKISRVRLTCIEELLRADWPEYEDPESELQRYEWCVGTTAAECNIWPLTSTGTHHQASAIVQKISSGTDLFATVNAVNEVGLKTHLVSNRCTVISVAPKISKVLDVSNNNGSSISDIDWTAMMQSLSIQWGVLGRYYQGISSMRIQVAFTQPSANVSVPRILGTQSWNGERIVYNFIDVLTQQRNATIRNVQLEAWQRYRGVVRVSNGSDIFAEKASDGIRMEPNPPPKRKLFIRDEAAEKEPARWWPLLRIPPVNQSAMDPDVMYISSPEDLVLEVRGDGANSSVSNDTSFILDHNYFSPTKEFRVSVVRVTSDKNETNTTEKTQDIKTLPGFANPEGPCCANASVDPRRIFSDMHLKPASSVQHFGASVALLPDGSLVVTSAGKAHVLQLKGSKTASHRKLSFAGSGEVQVVAHGNTTALLSGGEVRIYKMNKRINEPIDTSKAVTINNCKVISSSSCSSQETWADSIEHVIAIHDHVIALRGRISANNASVVGVFREANGTWQFAKVLGQGERDSSFGHSISLNDRLLVVASERNASIFVYSRESLGLLKKSYLSDFFSMPPPVSLHLTEADALILISRGVGTVHIVQLNMKQKSYTSICTYETRNGKYFSGNLDTTVENDRVIVALGMQTLEGRDGVHLIGFNELYSQRTSTNESKSCLDLGRVIARGTGVRVDDGVPRASVSFRGNKVVFGAPGVRTWPDLSEDAGTGRVYITTYCPRDHVRTRVSSLGKMDTFTCRPCEEGRRSFGGFDAECSMCGGLVCLPPKDDIFKFETYVCDVNTCPSVVSINNVTWGISTAQDNGSFFVSGSQHLYTVTLLETTRADMSTASYSEPFIIDSTPPTPGTVYDGLGSDQNLNCSQNETFGEDSQCSSRDFQDTDVDYTNNTAEIHARWIDFLDNQSDIIEYFWCVGSRPMRDDIRECESTGLRPNGSHYELQLQHGDSYYVTVVACNGARRCSAACSNGVTIDTTPPLMKYVRDGIMGPDMDFQVFLDVIFAYFRAIDLDSGVTSYEVAWGTSPNLTDVKDFEEIGNTTIWFAKFKDRGLQRGTKYYASVRATNGAGLISPVSSSNGIVVGKSEYVFDNKTSASFFFDTVDINVDGTRKDGGVGKTYGTLDVPEGAVSGEVKLRCYSLDEKAVAKNVSEEGPVSDPKKTVPKQFKLGNYSFQIKALDPVNNTVQEGYHFKKPITIAMFYDVDNLVNANKKVVSSDVEKEDVNPVLYLWDPKNESWFDASLTCPEPRSHVNRSIKLLTVDVCHLTQFAFFWSFRAQNGLIQFNKNSSLYEKSAEVEVTRKRDITNLALPIKRAKGSSGNISITWSLVHHASDDFAMIWPESGMIDMDEGQWNSSLTLSVAGDERELSEQVVWVQLDDATGGALLASRDQTRTKIVIAGNVKPPMNMLWIIVGGSGGGAILLVILVVCLAVKIRKLKSERNNRRPKRYKAPRVTLTGPSIDESMELSQAATRADTDALPRGTQGTLYNTPHSTLDSGRMFANEFYSSVEGLSGDNVPDDVITVPKPRGLFSPGKQEKRKPIRNFINPIYGTTGPTHSEDEVETTFTYDHDPAVVGAKRDNAQEAVDTWEDEGSSDSCTFLNGNCERASCATLPAVQPKTNSGKVHAWVETKADVPAKITEDHSKDIDKAGTQLRVPQPSGPDEESREIVGSARDIVRGSFSSLPGSVDDPDDESDV